MPNSFYVHGSYPTTSAPGASASMRAELELITAGFDKFPTLSIGANKAFVVNGAGMAVTFTTGTLALAGNFSTTGAFALSFAVTADTTLNLPTTGTLATLAGSETLTTKTINLTSNTLTGTIAQFNTACSDSDFATLAGSETLTTKTINLTSNTLTGTIAQFNAACSDSDFLITAGGNLTGGLNTAKSTVASATTPDIFATTVGNIVDYTGTATATGFASAPQAGASRLLRCAGASSFTAGANMLIDGVPSGGTATMAANDKVLVFAFTPTQFVLTLMRDTIPSVVLTDAATVAIDMAVGNGDFTLTIAGNRTLGAPTNTSNNLSGKIAITQDGTGARTLAYNAVWKFPGGTIPMLSTAAGAVDTLFYTVRDSTHIDAVLQKGWGS